MDKNVILVFFVLLMIIIIVAVDILIFRNYFWERLLSNIGIILIFVALYFRFFR